MYSGETSTYITGKTDTTRQINCLSDLTNCPYERSRWVETDDTICEGKALYSVLAEETSSDGVVWHRSDKRKLGIVINENDGNTCGATPEGKYGKWKEVDGYICDGTTKYKKVAFFQSDTINGTYTRTNIEDKGDVLETNSRDCGWFNNIGNYEIRWVKIGEVCIGTTKYAKFLAHYYRKDGTEYFPPKDQRKYEPIQVNSKDCGYLEEVFRWVLTDNIKCFECNE